MKHLVAVIMLLALTILASLILAVPINAQAGCGLKPLEIPPLGPPGCKMVQACSCDSKGNCQWVWACAN